MATVINTLLEGSYLYFNKDVNYSQENFKLLYLPDVQQYHVNAEILSRLETGEFLKVIVNYEMNQLFLAQLVRIEKTIGNKYAQELYEINTTNQELTYHFKTSETSQEFKRSVNSRHYLTSPAFSTAGLFLQTKKFNSAGRTPIVFLSSNNDWTYQGPPTEKIVFAEFKSREVPDFKLNGNILAASLLCLHEFDSTHPQSADEIPVDLFISKHYSLPYQLIQGDQKIIIKNLKRTAPQT